MRLTPFLILLSLGACANADPARVDIAITNHGFEPDRVVVQKGKPTTLVFKRTTDQTCATSVVVHTGASDIRKDLPLDQPVEIAATFEKSGDLGFACGMDMLMGVITVQ
jgi:plastocyanin domain-containing protein